MSTKKQADRTQTVANEEMRSWCHRRGFKPVDWDDLSDAMKQFWLNQAEALIKAGVA